MDASYLVMVLFLTAGTCANLPFLCRSILDMLPGRRLAQALPSAPAALLTTSFAECCWVIPCLIQCCIQLFNGDGPWSPAASGVGCDIMAVYSGFASISGMTSTLWVALLTYRAARGAPFTARASVIAGVAIIAGSAFVGALPLMGVGRYAYSGAGFCYFDFYAPATSVIVLVITLPTVVGTCTLLALSARAGGWPSSVDLWLMMLAFLSAWLLWVPATLIGLAGASFPEHFMIAGGFSGHAQALINPYVYGVRWRRSALQLAGTSQALKPAKVGLGDPEAPDLIATPSTAAVLDAPSAPPSPPGSVGRLQVV